MPPTDTAQTSASAVDSDHATLADFRQAVDTPPDSFRIPAADFTAPRHLLRKHGGPRRALLIGACVLDGWPEIIAQMPIPCQVDRILYFGSTNLPDELPAPIEDYDLQIVSIPLRSILNEHYYLGLSYDDPESYQRVFNETCERLRMSLDYTLRYNKERGLLSFVVGFLVPIANPMGRLLPRHDLRNMVYFIERLNEYLDGIIAGYKNVYYVDIAAVSATIGRRFVQDDTLAAFSHNALFADHAVDLDRQRLEPPTQSITDHFSSLKDDFVQAMWAEIFASYRSIRGHDSVKMVIMDLDDTLWRGVLGDNADFDHMMQLEGWPLGIAEALAFLKRRGVMLAIVSKNEESFITEKWHEIFHGRLKLSDFAFVRINWKPKAENISEILSIANILADSALFVDDNPVERAAVQAALPGIRAIGGHPYETRRVLLWSAETQVPAVTDESARRTEMMQNQERREIQRTAMDRSEFLRSLQVKVSLATVKDSSDSKFARTLELINKTNQFNTTGKRWTFEELTSAMVGGLEVFVFLVSDAFTNYGLVGVVMMDGPNIVQFVMSCRVLGMNVEVAVLDYLLRVREAVAPGVATQAILIETEKNFPSRDVFSRAGFEKVDDVWTRAAGVETPQDHVAIESAL